MWEKRTVKILSVITVEYNFQDAIRGRKSTCLNKAQKPATCNPQLATRNP